MALGIVDSVNRELPRVPRGAAYEHLKIACNASVLLCFFQPLDVLYHQLLRRKLAEVGRPLPLEAASRELAVIPHARDGEVGQITPLEVVINDPYFLGFFDSQTL